MIDKALDDERNRRWYILKAISSLQHYADGGDGQAEPLADSLREYLSEVLLSEEVQS